jgi:hypothetical protein
MTTWLKVHSYLDRFGLKTDGGDQWRCNNPWRVGADSMSFRLKIAADGEHGSYFDHASDEKGSLYELAEKLNIEPTRKLPAVEATKRAYRDLAEYAAVKGVPAQAFIDMMWKSETVTVKGRPALEFPTRGGKRWRFIDGEKPHFISEPGYKRCWYALERAIRIAKDTDQPLIICNGEPSTIVGQHFGLATTAVTSGEKKEIPAGLIDQLKEMYSGEIIVALDCDYKGISAALVMVKQFQSAGFKAKAIDLYLGETGDIADFCKLNGTESVEKLKACHEIIAPQQAAPSTTPKIEVSYTSDVEALQTYIDELNGDSVPSVPPLINPFKFLHKHGGLGHIIPAGKVLYFASVSGGTKTIGFETGWEAYQNQGVHNIIYSPEWIDDRGAVEMAARSVQRAGGVSFQEKMLQSLHQQERQFRLNTNAGQALPADRVSDSISRANMLIRRPGRSFFIKEPGMSAEKMCMSIEAICDLEAANGNTIRAAWLDFAQLLWMEKSDGTGRIWIEAAIGLFKDTCRRKNLVGFVSSQMRKNDAEDAKNNGKLSADMMQWLSDQQANFVLAFVPKMENGERAFALDHVNGRKVGLLRGRVLKNSLSELNNEEFDIPVDYMRLRWMEQAS